MSQMRWDLERETGIRNDVTVSEIRIWTPRQGMRSAKEHVFAGHKTMWLASGWATQAPNKHASWGYHDHLPSKP